MSRVGKLFKGIGMIISRPWLLNKIVESDEEFLKKVKKKYGITALPVASLDQFIKGEFDVFPFTFLDGTSSIIDHALLRALASSIKDCRYLEIGTWRGESVANVAAVAKECVTINLSDEEMRKKGWDERYIQSHRTLSSHLPNVQHVDANSLRDDLSRWGKFDLIFIDGDHHYLSVVSDTRKLLPLLRDENSVMVWHDYAFSPLQPRGEVMLGILDGMPEIEHSHLFQVEHSMCCVYSKKTFKSYPFDAHKSASKSFRIKGI